VFHPKGISAISRWLSAATPPDDGTTANRRPQRGRSAQLLRPHTSIKERVDHVKATGRIADVSEIRNGSVAATAVADGLESELWLIPIEDRRKHGALREGIRDGFTLGQYSMLVDYTSRLVRDGKAAVTAEVESIFTRLGSSAESWGARMLKLSGARLIGRFLSASRDRLREIAQRIGVRHLADVG